MLRCVFSLSFILAVHLIKFHDATAVTIYPEDPYSGVISDPAFVPDPEPYTNQTMDEVILSNFGGFQGYMSEHFFNDDGTVTAELDIRMSTQMFQEIYGQYFGSAPVPLRRKRKATRPEHLRWTNGIVPYEFVPGHFSASEVYKIKEALQRWMDTTCLQFRPAHSGDRNRIRFQNGAGCNSQLGMVGGTQAINLQAPGCRHMGLYLHEVGHAIGLVHEHQLPDRDTYITINYNNVAPEMRIWFNKYTSLQVNQYGVPYEYSSVMHYGITAFSYNGRAQTIYAIDRSRESEIGQVWAKGLSFSDIKVVNLMYQCNWHCTADSSCQSPGYLNKNCECTCPTDMDCSGGGGGGTTATVNPPTPTTTYMPSPPPSASTTTTTTTTTTSGCSNIWPDNECENWANSGECQINPDFMILNCRQACRECPEEATTTPVFPTTSTTSEPTTQSPTTMPPIVTTTPMPSSSTTPQATTTPMRLTSTALPETTTTETTTTSPLPTIETTYMPSPPPSTTAATTMTTTTTTTPTSTTEPVACFNAWGDTQCNIWQARGECSVNPTWMGQYCAKACSTCSDGGDGACTNQSPYCTAWSRQGYCYHNAHVQQNCRRACNTCGSGGGGANCQDFNNACASWASQGYCTYGYYVTYMSQNCRASCNLC